MWCFKPLNRYRCKELDWIQGILIRIICVNKISDRRIPKMINKSLMNFILIKICFSIPKKTKLPIQRYKKYSTSVFLSL